jgi:hydrogenase maturation protein HypF
MLGGAQAMREPWRNTLAHLLCHLGWSQVQERFGDLDIIRFLAAQPVDAFRAMADRGLNSPPASSCGRLFDAVAAAIGVCREVATHEGQAAIELESLATSAFRQQAGHAYPFELEAGEPGTLGWRGLWQALLGDLQAGVAPAVVAARFHQGLVQAVVQTAQTLCAEQGLDTVVLGGGVFQNRLLLEGVSEALRAAGLCVLSPERLPANDGGLALGQAAVAAARRLRA